MKVIWHDIECGSYREDLPVWQELAATYGSPVLDLGAGTGRVALELARAGAQVIALDHDPELLDELTRRAGGLPVSTLAADARDFALADPVATCLIPMQTIQLLGGAAGRAACLACARRAVRTGGVLAIAITPRVDVFDERSGSVLPLPDLREIDGIVYQSLPTAVRADAAGFVLERRREIVRTDGAHATGLDVIRLDRLSAAELQREATTAGFRPGVVRAIPATSDHVGSEVVILHG